ncbi:hypothetical protein B4077_3207 [Bacillus cereus]|uniref:IS6 family transposase n=1 Tax=Bacillus cereus TaxID=1396 RepID=A0A0G8EDG5_BACCE|nr:hypothetical protein B4077_3207 [Bacillus cereus]
MRKENSFGEFVKKGQLMLRDKSVQNEMKFIHQLFGMAA